MEKIKLLTLAVILLFILNLSLIGFLFYSNPNTPCAPLASDRDSGWRPRALIIESLHFDSNQQMEYDQLIQWHRSEIRKVEHTIGLSKNKLYQLLATPKVNIKSKDSLIRVLSRNQKQIETIHFKHFEDIKKLCHKDQLDYFNAITIKLAQLFSKEQQPPMPLHE